MPKLALERPGRVLIVDQSADSRSVFRTALERRGVQIFEAPGALQGLDIVRAQDPDVVVLDLESAADDDSSIRTAYASELVDRCGELVVLGNLRRCESLADEHVVRKPYHYGPLIRKIELLIEQSAHNRL